MDTNNKYGPFGREMLIRYLKGELSAEDSWKIEKAMQEDPLLSEAMDGLDAFPDKDLIHQDLAELEQMVNARTSKGKTRVIPVLIRVAAAFLILTVSTYIIIELLWKKPEDSTGIAMQKPTQEKDTGTTATFSDAGIKKSEETVVIPPAEKQKSENHTVLADRSSKVTGEAEEEIISGPVTKESETGSEAALADKVAGGGLQPGDSSNSGQQGYISDLILSASPENEEARPEKLDDYLMKGAGVAARDRETTREANPSREAKAAVSGDELPGQYMEPRPVIGDSSYADYIRANLRYPDRARQRIIQGDVILQFSVGKDSTIFNIHVISGPGGGCNEEAARLVREGPKWIPAYSNGIPVKSDVYYRIPFRITGR